MSTDVAGIADDPDMVPLDVEEWLSWLATERGRARSTLAAYRRDARRWCRWLDPRGVALPDVREADVEAYIAELRGGELAPATVARAVVAVRSLHRFLADEGRAPADPGADVATPRVPSGLPKALSEAEVEALLAAVVGDEPVARRDRAMLEVLYGTGVRISELVGLRLATSTWSRDCCGRSARAPRNGSCPWGATPPPPSPRGWGRGAARRWSPSAGSAGATPRQCS